jgi:hypothetical protein
MKKLIPVIICALLLSSFKLSAFQEFKLTPLKDSKSPFVISSLKKTDSDEGVKGKIMINAGVGFNIFATLLEARYYLSSNYDFNGYISSTKASPMYNLSLDYGLARKFSVGGAFGIQTAKVNFTNVYTNGDHYEDRWTRLHLAVRGDYYIVAKENLNLYTGLKLGYNIYTVKTTIPSNRDPEYLSYLDVTPQPISVQAHLGFSYYFMDMVGFNTEVGIGFGGPYLFAIGLAVKL